MARQYFDENYDDFLTHAEIKSNDLKYGLPDQKKYPMPDSSHVLSAIKFFNYVSPKDEETLAKAILARMEEYGITDVNVGPDNRFRKYYEKTELMHYRTPGSKNGVRLYQYPDGSWTPAGRQRYGKGGKPRGDYQDSGKTAAKNAKLIRRFENADFDGVNLKRDMVVNKTSIKRGIYDTTQKAEGNLLDKAASSKPAGVQALDKGESAYNTTKEYLEAITEDCWSPHGSAVTLDKRSIDEAATLGVQAVEKLRGPGYVDIENGVKESDKEWFTYEDQTDGLPMIANLINKGYSSKNVEKLIDELDKWDDDRYDLMQNPNSKAASPIFEVQNSDADELKRFAKICEDIKNEKASKITSHLSGADFDGDKSINLKQLKNDISSASRNTRFGYEVVKDLASKDSVKTLAEATQKEYEKYQSAAKKYQAIDESKKTDKDRQEFRQAREAYKTYLKEVADEALGDSKIDKVKTAYDWDGKTYRDGSQTVGEILQDALWRANIERNKNAERLSPAEYDGDTTKEPSRAEKKLAETQRKLADIADEKRSPKYLKNTDKKRDLEAKLSKLHTKTQRIRDDKIFNDREPGFFDRMKLNKERRLEKKLAKVDKKLSKVDRAENKLAQKQAKYERKVERQYKYDEKTRKAMREAREDGYDSLTNEQKQLLRQVALDMMDEI